MNWQHSQAASFGGILINYSHMRLVAWILISLCELPPVCPKTLIATAVFTVVDVILGIIQFTLHNASFFLRQPLDVFKFGRFIRLDSRVLLWIRGQVEEVSDEQVDGVFGGSRLAKVNGTKTKKNTR